MLGKRLLSLSLPLVIGAATLMATPLAQADVVPLAATAADQTITTTIIFNVNNPERLKSFIEETVTPGSPHYRKFMSVKEFVAHFAPSTGQIHLVAKYLAGFGITVTKVYDDHLAITVTGPASGFEQAFSTQLQNFQETTPGEHPYRRGHFHRPTSQPQIPALLTTNGVLAVVGLSNEFKYKPMHLAVPQLGNGEPLKPVLPQGNTIATGVPGSYTVGDVANLYNINPLYAEGVTGAGTTVGVATFANFYPEDAYTYWNSIGLTYKPDRITQVHVDGGGVIGAAAGTGETTLDVEQSGGLAPNANVIVYDAPNTTQAGIDLFYQIVSENRVDSLSYSWGLPEIFYYPETNGGVDYTSVLQSMNQAFMEAAAQGISLFTASGDSGAYDTARDVPPPYFSTPLSVDAPASSPYITAAGGTTVPWSGDIGCGPLTVSNERAWAWDYIANYAVDSCGWSPSRAFYSFFSVGNGGGVSVYWHEPLYQLGIPGMQTSQPDQSLIEYDVNPPYKYMDLPAGFHGRNVPDISMNADPYSGYLVYDTPDGGWIAGYGGTSFVAPQLNGIAALINQKAGGRIGFLNPQLYGLQRLLGNTAHSPFNDITHGDNWFYQAVLGYDPATGVGTPNVTRLANALTFFGH